MWGSAGFVFRAAGTVDYYELSFPAIGQAQRSEQVWLLVSHVRVAQGWRESIHFSLLPAVASEVGLLHHTRVEVLEDALIVTVDERARVRVPLPAESGPTRVGVSSYILSDIESGPCGTITNLSVAGTPPATPSTPFVWIPGERASSEVRVVNSSTGTAGIAAAPDGVGQIVRARHSGGEHAGDLFMINANM